MRGLVLFGAGLLARRPSGSARPTAGLRQRGATVGDPGLTPARARFSRLNDLGGVQIELMEFGPESMQRKAIESWKP